MSMFYSILPPIIVVLSLAGIIIFLVKKSSKIKKVYQEDAITLANKKSVELDASGNSGGERGGNWKKAENIFLIVMEKTTRRLRALFLKLEVWFSGLSGRIRNRRNGVISISTENNSKKEQQQEEVLEKVVSYKPKNISGNGSATGGILSVTEEEKIAEPMISKKATLPRSIPKVKNKLEDLLIERVAANPKDIEAYERLGEYYMEIETYNDAKECFKQVMKLCPTNRNVKYKIKRLERLLGE